MWTSILEDRLKTKRTTADGTQTDTVRHPPAGPTMPHNNQQDSQCFGPVEKNVP